MYKQYVQANKAGTDVDYWTAHWNTVGLPSKISAKTLLLTPQYREIKKRLDPPAMLLEAGCGPGHWVLRLAAKGYSMVGLDYSEPTIRRLGRQSPLHSWIAGDVRRTGLRDNSFDGVLSWGVIEHFESGPQEVLAEIYRLLRPGGYFFVTVPFLNQTRLANTRSTQADHESLPSSQWKFHQYWMTKDELQTFLEQAGFVVEIIRFGVKYPTKKLHWLDRKIPSKARTLINLVLTPFVSGEQYGRMILGIAKKPL